MRDREEIVKYSRKLTFGVWLHLDLKIRRGNLVTGGIILVWVISFLSECLGLSLEDVGVIKDWLPEWAREENYELKEVYIPPSWRGVGICQYNILTSGDKLEKDHEWLLENRIKYARESGYCYFHLDVRYGEGRNPHFWRYIGIIKMYERVQDLTSDMGGQECLLLYMDSDTMVSRFSVRMEDFREVMRDSFLYMSVDDSCEFQHYIVNVGVLLLSLRRLETLMFCIQVLALQRVQSLLPYSLEWSRSGLNDQNIVISLLNETGRLDVEGIQSYCLRRRHLTWRIYEDNWVNLNISKQDKGVVVASSLYLNHIIRMDQIVESDKVVSIWPEKAWIFHFSGSSRLEQCFMIKRLCQERSRGLDPSLGSQTKECPEKLDELMTEKESRKVETLFSSNMNSQLDPNNYIGQHHQEWIENLKMVDLGIKSLSSRYSILINRYV